MGIKPLYYSICEDNLFFASEIKAILEYPEIYRQIDENAMVSYFTLGYIPNHLTIFKNIYKLEPGHFMKIKDNSFEIKNYWDLYFEPDYSIKENEHIIWFIGLLEESVKLRMISDVPIGAFLSGGVDSGTIVAIMSKMNQSPVNTCCIGYGGNIGGFLDERIRQNNCQ